MMRLLIFFIPLLLLSCSNKPNGEVYGKWEFVSYEQLKPLEFVEEEFKNPENLCYIFGATLWSGREGKTLEFTKEGQIKGDYIPEIGVEKLNMTFSYEKGEDLIFIFYHPEKPDQAIERKIPVRFEENFMYLTIEGFLEVKFKFVGS